MADERPTSGMGARNGGWGKPGGVVGWVYASGAANAVFYTLTFSGAIFMLFLSALGLNTARIGVILSFFPFCGLLAPLIARRVEMFGAKRAYLVFYSLRTVLMATLLLTPWVVTMWGATVGFRFVAVVMFLFAVSRAIAETGYFPWSREFVPAEMRGKYGAILQAVSAATSVAALAGAGWYLARGEGLPRFMTLMAVGIVFEALALVLAAKVPGGGPHNPSRATTPFVELWGAVKDRAFMRYLVGLSACTLATGVWGFVPLYLSRQVGMTAGQVVWLQNAGLVASLFLWFVWGWAADRFGGKAVLMIGLTMTALQPLGYLLLPFQKAQWQVGIAMGVLAWTGGSAAAVGIGSDWLLFVRLIRPERGVALTAINYACLGLMGGMGFLGAGFFVDVVSRFTDLPDPYAPLFVLGSSLAILSLVGFHGIDGGGVSARRLAIMILRTNPLHLAETVWRYYAEQERKDEAK